MTDDLAARREALIRGAYERWNAGERGALADDITDDFVLDSTLTGQTFHGRQGFAEWMDEIDSNFDAWQLHLGELRRVAPDRYVALGSVHLRGRGSGVEFDQPVGWVFEFEGEKVARMQTLPSHEAAIDAAASRWSS